MKKFIALLLALTLALSLAVTVSAETVTETGAKSETVTGTYVAGSASTTVYSIDIAWGDLSFTYTAGSEGMWDPETLTYSGTTEGKWSASKEITVTNKSNAAVTVTAAFAAAEGFEVAQIQLDNETVIIGSADNNEGVDGTPKALTGTFTLTPTGTLPEGTENATIGTVTLTIE